VTVPYLVIRVEEIERLEDASVVDEDVDMRNFGDEGTASFRCGDVGCDRRHASPGAFAFQAFGCLGGLLVGPAVDYYVRAGPRELPDDCVSDAFRGPCNECGLACKVDLHLQLL
jgi:hypothetical protein